MQQVYVKRESSKKEEGLKGKKKICTISGEFENNLELSKIESAHTRYGYFVKTSVRTVT